MGGLCGAAGLRLAPRTHAARDFSPAVDYLVVMDLKTLNVQCPCCKATLVVDAETGAVLSHREHKKSLESFDDFLAKQKSRTSELDAKFQAAQEREKNKIDLLNKKFEAAKQNPDLQDPPPSVQWD